MRSDVKQQQNQIK